MNNFGANIGIHRSLDQTTLASRVDTLMLHAFDAPFNQGLADGQLGIALVLHHYASLMSDQEVHDFAIYQTDYVISRAAMLPRLDLESGLMGLGWGLEYLVQNGMADCNTADICEEIDFYLLTVSPLTLCQEQDFKGLDGMLNYLMVHYQNMSDALQQCFKAWFSDILKELHRFCRDSYDSLDQIHYLCERLEQLKMIGVKQTEVPQLSRFIHLSRVVSGYGLRYGMAGKVEMALKHALESPSASH